MRFEEQPSVVGEQAVAALGVAYDPDRGEEVQEIRERKAVSSRVLPVDHGDPAVRADQKALRRVISNLIENAIKYTPDGGHITLAACRAGDEVEISVTDNGRGIPPQDLPVLFDKFHRGRPAPVAADGALAAALPELEEVPGIGLGLYLARSVTEQMGGRISVESEVGRGSAFTLHLPVWGNGEEQPSMREEGRDVQTIAGSR